MGADKEKSGSTRLKAWLFGQPVSSLSQFLTCSRQDIDNHAADYFFWKIFGCPTTRGGELENLIRHMTISHDR